MGQTLKMNDERVMPGDAGTADTVVMELFKYDLGEEQILELQLTMATTSINHEYAKIEYEDSIDYERQEELLTYMAECRGKYMEARSRLANHNPDALQTFEEDLKLQKMATLTHYSA